MRLISWFILLAVVVFPASLLAQAPQPATQPVLIDSRTPGRPLVLSAELGSLAVLSHRIQYGRGGTYFDLKNDGGQDTLYFNAKFALDLSVTDRHHVIALYQPLEIETEEQLRRDFVTDEVTFPAGTPMRFQYGFPFYRLSYVYDVIDNSRTRLGFGGSLQVRNATIVFASLDGTLARASRDVGPVPLIKAVWERHPKATWWYGTEVDAIYAPISYLNGSDTEVRGALVDLNLRVGKPIHETADIYLNLRYLAGGAVGASDDPRPGDDYVRNWLHFGILGVGFRLNP